LIEVLKAINLAAAFILELCALASLGYWGFNASDNALLRTFLGVGAPLGMAVLWGIFFAPKSSRRLKETALTIAKLIIFALASIALAASGQVTMAAILMAATVVNLTLALIWQQY